MSTQVAWVMISNFLPVLFRQFKLSVVNELEQILGDMNHVKVDLELGILVFEGVVAMGGGNEDFIDPMVDEGLDVFSGQAFEQFLLTRLADAFSAAVFLGSQNPEIRFRLVKNIGCGGGDLF